MLKTGVNIVDGVLVKVVRRRAKRINIRIDEDGTVSLTVPYWWATIAQGAAFLSSKWDWVLQTRERLLSRPAVQRREPTGEEVARLQLLLGELNALWGERLNEPGVTWKLRRMKTLWGVCHFDKRQISYALTLALKPRELVEYVVVHELTHLKVHGHGEAFKSLMDERLPGWRQLRRRLNGGESSVPPVAPPDVRDKGAGDESAEHQRDDEHLQILA